MAEFINRETLLKLANIAKENLKNVTFAVTEKGTCRNYRQIEKGEVHNG